jgi:hypothetical protein
MIHPVRVNLPAATAIRRAAAIVAAAMALVPDLCGTAAAAWQMSVSPAVVLSARDTANEPFDADFALTSPLGPTRHAHVASSADGVATVAFGGPDTNGPFGLPEENFSPSTIGRWTWVCSVKGHPIAHGSFLIARDRAGHASIQTQPAVF